MKTGILLAITYINQIEKTNEEKERQKEIKEKLESEGLDPDEFDEDPPPHEATDGHSEQPACAEASAGREELADLPTTAAKRSVANNHKLL